MRKTNKTKGNIVTGRKDVVYVYAIFLTPNGKGYGCFAIKKTEELNKFLVGASYCHPSDSNKFSKSLARDIALGRATKEYIFDLELKLDSIFIAKNAISGTDQIEMPYWAEKAYDVGSFCFKLSNDKYSASQLLEKMIEEDVDIESGYLKWTLQLLRHSEQLLKQHSCNDCKNYPV